MDVFFTIFLWTIGLCFAAAGVFATIRIVRGPSIVDRMVGSDTLLTVFISALSAEMVINGHTNTLPLVLGLAMTASVGTMAVARFVSRDRPRRDIGIEEGAQEPSEFDGADGLDGADEFDSAEVEERLRRVERQSSPSESKGPADTGRGQSE